MAVGRTESVRTSPQVTDANLQRIKENGREAFLKAKELQNEGKHKEAFVELHKALKFAEQTNDKRSVVVIKYYMAEAYFTARGESGKERTAKLLRSALQDAEKVKEPTPLVINILKKIADFQKTKLGLIEEASKTIKLADNLEKRKTQLGTITPDAKEETKPATSPRSSSLPKATQAKGIKTYFESVYGLETKIQGADLLVRNNGNWIKVKGVKANDGISKAEDEKVVKAAENAGIKVETNENLKELAWKGMEVDGAEDGNLDNEATELVATLNYYARTRYVSYEQASHIYSKHNGGFEMETEAENAKTVKALREGTFKDFLALKPEEQTVDKFASYIKDEKNKSAIKQYAAFMWPGVTKLSKAQINQLIGITAVLDHIAALDADLREKFFGISEIRTAHKGESNADNKVKWVQGEKVEEKKEKGEKKGASENDYQKAFYKAGRAAYEGNISEAEKQYKAAIEKAPDDAKRKSATEKLVRLYVGEVSKFDDFKKGLADMKSETIDENVKKYTELLVKLESYKHDVEGRVKGALDKLLEPEKWDDKNINDRSVRGYLKKLATPTGKAFLKAEAQFGKVAEENKEVIDILAKKEARIAAIQSSGASRKEKAEKLIKFALAYSKVLEDNEASLKGSNKRESIEQTIFFAYTMAGMLDLTKFDSGVKYYAERTKDVKIPKDEYEAQLLQNQAGLIRQKAATIYKLAAMDKKNSKKLKKEALDLIKKQAKPLFKRVYAFYNAKLKEVKAKIAAAGGKPEELALLQPQFQKYDKKVKALKEALKAGTRGKITDDPQFRAGVDAIVKNKGRKRVRGGATRRRSSGKPSRPTI